MIDSECSKFSVGKFAATIVLVIVCLVMLTPIIFAVINSFKPYAEMIDLPEKVRHEHSGDEGISVPVSDGRVNDPPAQGDAGPEAGGAAPLHPGAGGQRGLYRLEAEYLGRTSLRQAPL